MQGVEIDARVRCVYIFTKRKTGVNHRQRRRGPRTHVVQRGLHGLRRRGSRGGLLEEEDAAADGAIVKWSLLCAQVRGNIIALNEAYRNNAGSEVGRESGYVHRFPLFPWCSFFRAFL